ncbi:hypothetical protein RclHR1_08500006 [Rhizophagus clarus]|uniref:F-box domain-containing protein n=1 Tax=Rhizophagus clarus TaxID=94130 RepID=A0A2Z6S3B8_9GLOM|nr:hypothetical protein RclHR1_08500006 [Rhizophagus clarus]GES73919.1 hypothetical protein GLOIN_2v1881853 [Rhizophagus clarus]
MLDLFNKLFFLAKPFKLKSLFINEILEVKPLELLLQSIGDYLENFGLSPLHNTSLFLQQQLLKLTTRYCKNIAFLDFCGFESQIANQIFNLIKNIEHNLNYLSIDLKSENNKTEFSSITLQYLGQILPSKFEYLNLGK